MRRWHVEDSGTNWLHMWTIRSGYIRGSHKWTRNVLPLRSSSIRLLFQSVWAIRLTRGSGSLQRRKNRASLRQTCNKRSSHAHNKHSQAVTITPIAASQPASQPASQVNKQRFNLRMTFHLNTLRGKFLTALQAGLLEAVARKLEKNKVTQPWANPSCEKSGLLLLWINFRTNDRCVTPTTATCVYPNTPMWAGVLSTLNLLHTRPPVVLFNVYVNKSSQWA